MAQFTSIVIIITGFGHEIGELILLVHLGLQLSSQSIEPQCGVLN
jgi:hypothetical protein